MVIKTRIVSLVKSTEKKPNHSDSISENRCTFYIFLNGNSKSKQKVEEPSFISVKEISTKKLTSGEILEMDSPLLQATIFH